MSEPDELTPGTATLCIVNYKTPEMIQLCLRSIRRYTRFPHRVVVVDNDSQDASLDYLKGLDWITLVENRPGAVGGSRSHGLGLQAGFERCRTEYFVSMHSDAIVRREGWLAELVAHMESDERIASVGSGKLDPLPSPRLYEWWRQGGHLKRHLRRLLGRPERHTTRYYNRSICCLYRTEVLRREKLSFLYEEERDLQAGAALHYALVDRGYRSVDLPTAELGRLVFHLAHATAVRNPELGVGRKTRRKYEKRLARVLTSPAITQVMDDASLDR